MGLDGYRFAGRVVHDGRERGDGGDASHHVDHWPGSAAVGLATSAGPLGPRPGWSHQVTARVVRHDLASAWVSTCGWGRTPVLGVHAVDVASPRFRKLLTSAVNGGPDVDEAISLAFRQLREGIPDQQIVQQLRELPGGSKTLHKAARLAATGNPGYPVNRCCALLKVAAEGLAMPDIPAEQRAQEEAQRQLMNGDPATGFAMLAQRAPALLDLEQRARAGLSKPEWDMAMRHAADVANQESKAVFVSMFLMNQSPIVGPNLIPPTP